MLLEHKNAIVYRGGGSATFMASDGAGPMTATFANISCGAILD
jgi:hypothetical protein